MILAKSAFAKHIGRSAAYVTKLKNEGRLVLEGGKVKVEESLARMAATAGNRDDVAGRHARNRSGEGAGAPSAPVESKAFAISRKESAQADIAEMERDALRGRLVPRDDVESALKFVGAAFATLLDNLPSQNAAVLAPIATPEAMEDALADLCDTLRHQFGDAIARQQAVLNERKKP